MESFSIGVYNGVVLPLLRIGLAIGKAVNRKVRRGMQGRARLFERLEESTSGSAGCSPRFWIHSSSMGEFEQAKPVILALRKRFPDAFVAVSFFSPSGFEHVKAFPGADCICYIPFDSPANADRFIRILRPDAGTVVRHDVWPNHIAALKRQGIPAVLINYSLRPRTGFTLPWVRAVFRMCLRPFDHVLAVSAETRDLSMKLGFTSVTPDVVGDTRYDQVIRRTEDAERVVAPLRPLKCGRPCLVFGSTWPSDESVVFGLLRGFRERGMEVWSVLVPHEPTKKHLRQIELECDAAGLRWKRLSAVSMDPGSPAGRDAPDVNAPDPAVFDHQVFDVLIVDRVGILANLYALADAAFVGGGFGPGVHSVLEPAAFGKPVFFGPRCRNSFEAGQLETRGGGMVVRDGGEFTDLLLPLLQDPAKLRAAGENALALVRDNIGATERIADRLAAIVRSRD